MKKNYKVGGGEEETIVDSFWHVLTSCMGPDDEPIVKLWEWREGETV